jgi:uncharacterized cupredoxin-like copper-binding protein
VVRRITGLLVLFILLAGCSEPVSKDVGEFRVEESDFYAVGIIETLQKKQGVSDFTFKVNNQEIQKGFVIKHAKCNAHSLEFYVQFPGFKETIKEVWLIAPFKQKASNEKGKLRVIIKEDFLDHFSGRQYEQHLDYCLNRRVG